MREKKRIGALLTYVVSVLGLLYLLFVMLGIVAKDRLGTIEVVLFGLILLFNSDLLGRLEKLQFGKEGIAIELDQLKDEQVKLRKLGEANEEEIQHIVHFLASNFLDKYEVNHLKSLLADSPFKCKRGPAFDAELRRLRDLDLLESASGGQLRVSQLPDRMDDLKQHVRITQRGQECLAMVEKSLASGNKRRSLTVNRDENDPESRG